MSADNWAICPKCKKANDDKVLKFAELVRDSYGKLSAEEYIKMMEQVRTTNELDDTLREDYEIGISEDGIFSVSYSARCDKCGFKYEYEETAICNPDQ